MSWKKISETIGKRMDKNVEKLEIQKLGENKHQGQMNKH